MAETTTTSSLSTGPSSTRTEPPEELDLVDATLSKLAASANGPGGGALVSPVSADAGGARMNSTGGTTSAAPGPGEGNFITQEMIVRNNDLDRPAIEFLLNGRVPTPQDMTQNPNVRYVFPQGGGRTGSPWPYAGKDRYPWPGDFPPQPSGSSQKTSASVETIDPRLPLQGRPLRRSPASTALNETLLSGLGPRPPASVPSAAGDPGPGPQPPSAAPRAYAPGVNATTIQDQRQWLGDPTNLDDGLRLLAGAVYNQNQALNGPVVAYEKAETRGFKDYIPMAVAREDLARWQGRRGKSLLQDVRFRGDGVMIHPSGIPFMITTTRRPGSEQEELRLSFPGLDENRLHQTSSAEGTPSNSTPSRSVWHPNFRRRSGAEQRRREGYDAIMEIVVQHYRQNRDRFERMIYDTHSEGADPDCHGHYAALSAAKYFHPSHQIQGVNFGLARTQYSDEVLGMIAQQTGEDPRTVLGRSNIVIGSQNRPAHPSFFSRKNSEPVIGATFVLPQGTPHIGPKGQQDLDAMVFGGPVHTGLLTTLGAQRNNDPHVSLTREIPVRLRSKMSTRL